MKLSFWRVGFFSLFLLPGWGGAQPRVSEAPPQAPSIPAASNLARLGGMIQAALPGLSENHLVVPRIGLKELRVLPSGISKRHAGDMVPALWSPERALELLRRAEKMDPAGVANFARRAAEEWNGDEARQVQEAHRILHGINSIFKHVPSEAGNALPLDELNKLAALVLEPMGRADSQKYLEGIAVLSRLYLDGALSLPYQETSRNPGSGDYKEEYISVRGVPSSVRLLAAPPDSYRNSDPTFRDVVFRHYTSREGVHEILGSGRMRNGWMSYVHRIKGVTRKTFLDLTGIFLTTPRMVDINSNRSVLAYDHPYYVDVLVPASLPLLEIVQDQTYLIPLPSRTIEWMMTPYLDWVRGRDVSDHGAVSRLDAAGGPNPSLEVSIMPVAHGIVGMNRNMFHVPREMRKATNVPGDMGARIERSRLGRLLQTKSMRPQSLISALKKDPALRFLYKVPVVKEGYTVEEHTLMVLGVFERFLSDFKFPVGMDRALFRLALALHDIGKSSALISGDLSTEHARTLEIVRSLLGNLGYSADQVRMVAALLDGDPIGQYLQGNIDLQQSSRRIREMQADSGLTMEDFMGLLALFFMSDAGSYTRVAGGMGATDSTFDFWPDQKTMAISSYSSVQLGQLRRALGLSAS